MEENQSYGGIIISGGQKIHSLILGDVFHEAALAHCSLKSGMVPIEQPCSLDGKQLYSSGWVDLLNEEGKILRPHHSDPTELVEMRGRRVKSRIELPDRSYRFLQLLLTEQVEDATFKIYRDFFSYKDFSTLQFQDPNEENWGLDYNGY